MESKITVVIPYMDRAENLWEALGALRRQTNIPFDTLIPCYGLTAGVEFPPGLNAHAWFEGEEYSFTRTGAINAGVAHVKTPLTAILDADCLLPPPTLADAQALIEKGAGIVGAPFFAIQPDGTSQRFEANGRMITGGFQAFRTADFRAIGGMNPFMVKWGYEDRDFVQRMVNYRISLNRKPSMGAAYLPYPYFHQWHPPATGVYGEPGEDENIRIGLSSKWTGKEWVRT